MPWCLVETSVWLRGILTLMRFLKEIEASEPSWFPVGVLSFHLPVKPNLSSMFGTLPPSFWKGGLVNLPLWQPRTLFPKLTNLQSIISRQNVHWLHMPKGPFLHSWPSPSLSLSVFLFNPSASKNMLCLSAGLGRVVWCLL